MQLNVVNLPGQFTESDVRHQELVESLDVPGDELPDITRESQYEGTDRPKTDDARKILVLDKTIN